MTLFRLVIAKCAHLCTCCDLCHIIICRVNPIDYSWETKLLIPKIRIEGNYHMQGRILVIPLNGHGKCFFEPSKFYDFETFGNFEFWQRTSWATHFPWSSSIIQPKKIRICFVYMCVFFSLFLRLFFYYSHAITCRAIKILTTKHNLQVMQ